MVLCDREERVDDGMKYTVNSDIYLESITRSSTDALYPLFMEDIGELNRWFGFDPDYSIQNDYQYLETRRPPFDDAAVIFYQGSPCGRFGLYDYCSEEHRIFMYYWVSSRFRRKGIARLCMGAMLDYLRDLDIKEVCFDVHRENLASIALLEGYPKIQLKIQEKHLIYSCFL